ncbi:MAG TPA: NifU family protein [Gemmatimonadales bacterium]|nr:NifU family protein [Gemmatimonadales bacterium]
MTPSRGALDDREVRARVEEVEALLSALDALPDDRARTTALDAVQAVVELYGEALARVLGGVSESCGAAAVRRLADDELIGHLLLVHDLHPDSVEARVLRGLDEVRPYLRSHGGGVELLGVADGMARVKLEGSCHGCPSSTATLRHAIEEAVRKAAPELDGIVAEGTAPPARTAPEPAALVQLAGAARNGA